MFGANDFQQIPWSSTFLVTGPQINVMGCFNLFFNIEFRFKKDFRVFRVGLRWSYNGFFSFPIKVLFPKLTINITREREREQAHLENVVQQSVVCYIREG
jgi:hypothetical protein